MRNTMPLLILSALLITLPLRAVSYKYHDIKLILIPTEMAAEKKPAVNMSYLDEWLLDLSRHAKNYPIDFDSLQDKERATQDVKMLTGLMDVMINVPEPSPEFLRRAGFLNSMGHNLDIPGCAKKALTIFQQLLTLLPSDPQGNYMFGAFLGGIGKASEAIPYLLKAHSSGVPEAPFTLGMAYLMTGNKEKALEYFLLYREKNPGDKSIDKIINSIQRGKVEFKHTSN